MKQPKEKAMENENTERTGAEPDNTAEGKTEGKVGAEPVVKDVKSDSSTDVNVPWNKDPRFQEFIKEKNTLTAASKKLEKLLKENELDDPEDLAELVQKGKAVKGKLSDLNQLDTLMEKANRLDQYEEYWKSQAEKKRRETEDPEQTIARLEEALNSKNVLERQKAQKMLEADRAKQAIDGYDREVENLISEIDMPKDQRGFLLEFMGVKNPINEIDITDKKAVRRIVSEAAKKKDAYDQSVIAAYLKGKGNTPRVGSAQTGAPELNKPKIMLRDGSAKRAFLERMRLPGG
jgi:hypothetical protein